MQAATKQGISLPGEAEDKCCYAVPIKYGVIAIGAGIVYSAVMGVLAGLRILGLDGGFIYGVLYLAAQAPLALSAWYFISFFRGDTKETREGLQKACMLTILSAIAVAAVLLVQGLMAGNFLIGVIIGPAITFVIYTYFAGVCKRYAGQA